jgi:hypothetical protein
LEIYVWAANSRVAAAAIVCVFEVISPATKDSTGQLSFDAFGAKFSGPAAPATLWIVTYLALALTIVAITGKPDSKVDASEQPLSNPGQAPQK